MSAARSEQVGRFELRETLGRGSTGCVYRAWDPFVAADLALKVFDRRLLLSALAEADVAVQFMREASLVGKLCHPHIASILEASAATEPAYVAMEYVPGGNLAQYASVSTLMSPAQLMQVAFKTCGALDYAGKRGIVHRDIKPANLLLAHGTNVKVVDFGAARLKSGATERPGTLGSPAYMSPEQINGGEVSGQSDMFSLGVELYELLSGQRPFVGKDLPQVVERVLRHEPPAPSTLRSVIDPKIDAMVLRMLQKRPADRHASWAEVALDIAAAGRLGISNQQVTDSEKYGALRRLPLLEKLDDAEIWELVHAGRWRRVPASVVLVREGEAGRTLFFLAQGEIKVTKGGRLLNVLSAGEYFGEMAYVKRGALTRQATVETMSDAVLCEFDAELLGGASSNCRLHLAHALLDNLVDRLQFANERILDVRGIPLL
jgi:hypothetical protein